VAGQVPVNMHSGNVDHPYDSGLAHFLYISGLTVISEFLIYVDITIDRFIITLSAIEGSTLQVNKSFTFRMDCEGNLQFITHHFSP
jgi:hypothetical protein